MRDDYAWPVHPHVLYLLELFAQLRVEVRDQVHGAGSDETRGALLSVALRIGELEDRARAHVAQPAQRPAPRPDSSTPVPVQPCTPLDKHWPWQTHDEATP